LPGYTAADITFQFKATPPLTADFDGNDVVDDKDFALWEGDFMQNGDSDSDGDGDSDGIDFLAWQRGMGRDYSPAIAATVVPEPTSLALAIISALALFNHHRGNNYHRRNRDSY
jgi:hypothetical protein